MKYAIPLPAPVTLPIDGSDAVFPVLRVFCVGRNYAEHAVEMGHDPDREPAIWLRVNGELRQEGDLGQQIWKVPETIAYLSTPVELRPGDLIMTGTPSGVGRVVPGDRLEGHVDGLGDLTVEYIG